MEIYCAHWKSKSKPKPKVSDHHKPFSGISKWQKEQLFSLPTRYIRAPANSTRLTSIVKNAQDSKLSVSSCARQNLTKYITFVPIVKCKETSGELYKKAVEFLAVQRLRLVLSQEPKEAPLRHQKSKTNADKTSEKFRMFEKYHLVYVDINTAQLFAEVDASSSNSRTKKKICLEIWKFSRNYLSQKRRHPRRKL